MATDFYCDRCGDRFVPGAYVGHLSLQQARPGPQPATTPHDDEPAAASAYLPRRFDLCQRCHAALEQWLRPETPRETMV